MSLNLAIFLAQILLFSYHSDHLTFFWVSWLLLLLSLCKNFGFLALKNMHHFPNPCLQTFHPLSVMLFIFLKVPALMPFAFNFPAPILLLWSNHISLWNIHLVHLDWKRKLLNACVKGPALILSVINLLDFCLSQFLAPMLDSAPLAFVSSPYWVSFLNYSAAVSAVEWL